MNAKTETTIADPLEESRETLRQNNRRMTELQASMKTLSARADTAKPIRAKLAEFDAAAEQAMSAWATKGGSGDPPAVDHVKRRKLLDELESAEASDRATHAAVDTMTREYNELARQSNEGRARLRTAALRTMVAEGEEYAQKMVEAYREVERNNQYLVALVRMISRLRSDNDTLRTVELQQVMDVNELTRRAQDVVKPAIAASEAHWNERFAELTAD